VVFCLQIASLSRDSTAIRKQIYMGETEMTHKMGDCAVLLSVN